ncbi:protein of unknown function [Hyphomicrobium sp. 1Nfss2.1]
MLVIADFASKTEKWGGLQLIAALRAIFTRCLT